MIAITIISAGLVLLGLVICLYGFSFNPVAGAGAPGSIVILVGLSAWALALTLTGINGVMAVARYFSGAL